MTGSGSITGWEYQQKHGTNNYGERRHREQDWNDISSTSKSLSYTVTGLTNGDNYKFKVRAKNATGDGVISDESDTAWSPSVRSLAGGNLGTDHGHPDHRRARRQLVLQGQRLAGHHLQGAGERADEEPDEPVVDQHQLHLRGVQRQFLHLREPVGDLRPRS